MQAAASVGTAPGGVAQGGRDLQGDQIQVRRGGCHRHRPDREGDRGEVAVGFHPQVGVAHRRLRQADLVQGPGQLPPQAFPRHFQDIDDADRAGSGLQILASAAVQIQDVALAIHQRGGRDDLLQQGLFGQFAQRRRAGEARVKGQGGGRHRRTARGQGRRQLAHRAPRGVHHGGLPSIQPLRAVLQGKEAVGAFAHRLRGAEEEITAGVQRIVKQGHEPLLQLSVQIDQQVAATGQVQFGEGRVPDQVLFGKDHQVADAFVDAVGATVGLDGKIPCQPFRREVGGDAGWIEADTGGGNGLTVDISGEHLDPEGLFQRLLALGQQDGEGVGLLAGGAAHRPDPDHRRGSLVGKELGDDPLLQGLEGRRIAEELGDADQQIVEQGLQLGRGLLHILDIVVQAVDLVDGLAVGEAPRDGTPLVLGEVVAGLGAQQHQDLPQGVLGRGLGVGGLPGERAEGLGDIGDELGGHLGGLQLIVHQAGGQGAARHAVVLGRGGVLDHDHAALALDRPHAVVAVTAGAGEDDADGVFPLILRQGAKEKVDRQALATGGTRCQ